MPTPKKTISSRKCETCDNITAAMDDRFCSQCKKEKLRLLQEEGYLTNTYVGQPIRESRGRKALSNPGSFDHLIIDRD